MEWQTKRQKLLGNIIEPIRYKEKCYKQVSIKGSKSAKKN